MGMPLFDSGAIKESRLRFARRGRAFELEADPAWAGNFFRRRCRGQTIDSSSAVRVIEVNSPFVVPVGDGSVRIEAHEA